jgi:hypothetical protein
MGHCIAGHRGRVVDTPGDALLAEFSSPVEAVEASVEIHATLAARNAELPEDRRMLMRIGINLRDAIEQDGALYGDTCNCIGASRSCSGRRSGNRRAGRAGLALEATAEQRHSLQQASKHTDWFTHPNAQTSTLPPCATTFPRHRPRLVTSLRDKLLALRPCAEVAPFVRTDSQVS